MESKLILISELAEQTTQQITNNAQEWTTFLTTAARLYKYSFDDQLLIYAQRPDVTACATIEQWNSKVHRWVNAGSTGIALIKKGGGRPCLEYVFDISDTHAIRGAHDPKIWQMQKEHYAAVLERIEKNRLVSDNSNCIEEKLMELASRVVQENYADAFHELMTMRDYSFLEELDELNTNVIYLNILTASVQYTLLSRCGLDASQYLNESDFRGIINFNTVSTLTCLGTASQDISLALLHQIEQTIKQFDQKKVLTPLEKLDQEEYTNNIRFSTLKRERSVQNDRINIHEERGLLDSLPDNGRSGAGGQPESRQVWNASANLPAGTPEGDVHIPVTDRTVMETLAGDRHNSAGAYRPDRERDTENRPGAGQSDQSDGLGTAYEQLESIGGGNSAERTGLQLNTEEKAADEESAVFSSMDNNSPTFLQSSLFPTVEEQVDTIAQSKAEAHAPAFLFSTVTDDVIDRIFTSGGNFLNSYGTCARIAVMKQMKADISLKSTRFILLMVVSPKIQLSYMHYSKHGMALLKSQTK